METQNTQEQVIQLKPIDDVAVIREAMVWSKAERVILVVPPSVR